MAEFLICCRVCSGGSNEHINVKIGLDKKNRFFMKHPNHEDRVASDDAHAHGVAVNRVRNHIR